MRITTHKEKNDKQFVWNVESTSATIFSRRNGYIGFRVFGRSILIRVFGYQIDEK